jgi:hypothetical protein
MVSNYGHEWQMQSEQDNVLAGGGQGARRCQIVASPAPHGPSSPVPSCEPLAQGYSPAE